MDGWEEYGIGSQVETQYSDYNGCQNNHTLPCGCPAPWPPNDSQQCVLNKPMGIVIGPKGIHLSCPAHPAGHHIYGQSGWC